MFIFMYISDPDATYICHAYQRIMEDGDTGPHMGDWFQVPCDVEAGHGFLWAVTNCADLPYIVCGICAQAIDIYGQTTDCLEVTYAEP